jgi:TfoX/Sxy family transcriptional regulator of competence genes
MTFDPDLANRIRELLSAQRGIEEKRMFGGLAFLINGNMAVAANRGGGLLVRVAPEDTQQLLSREHVELMAMGGREMRGWLQVDAAAVRTKRQLQSWVSRGVGYAGSLPPK